MGLSSISRPEQFCLRMTTMLDGNAAPVNVKKESAVIDAIASPRNMDGFNVAGVQNPTLGKTPPTATNPIPANTAALTIEYDLPFCAGGTSAGSTKICDDFSASPGAHQYGYLQLGITKVAERHFQLSLDDFNQFCETPNERQAKLLRKLAYQIRQEVNSEAIKEMWIAADAYTDSTASNSHATVKTLNVIKSDGSALNADYAKLLAEYRKANYDGSIMVFGGETLATYRDVRALQTLGLGNQNAVNPELLLGNDLIYDSALDPLIQTQLGVNADNKSKGISVALGNFGFFEWFEYKNYKELSFEDHVATTMVIDGWEYDVEIKFDKCEKIWKVLMKKYYDFGQIPHTAYCGSQGLMFGWTFDCGDFACGTL